MAPASLESQLRAEMEAWESAGLLRTLELPEGADFTSNDYLGLARDPRVISAARAALEEWGAGAGAARLLRGNLTPHVSAEATAAEWLGCESALLFPSGWQANLAVLSALAGPDDLIFSDALNHASLIDGSRLSRADVRVFRHTDLADLQRLLRGARKARRRLIVTESIFSMDGDTAPLADFVALCEEHDAWLIVDEAHAIGVAGPQGAGLAATLAGDRVLARIATGGKALGVCGAFVAGSRSMINCLVNRGRSFIFTTASAPATAAALQAAIGIVRAEPARRTRLLELAGRLRTALAPLGVPTEAQGAIVPLVLGDATHAMNVAADLRSNGFDVRAVRPPTVPPGTSRLRLVLHADHEAEQVDALAAAVHAAVAAHPPVSNPEPRTFTACDLPWVVVGTDTGVGKTVVSALLCRAAMQRGHATSYLKIVQTGDESDTATVESLAGLDEQAAPVQSFALPASVDQAAQAEGRSVTATVLVDGAAAAVASSPESRWILETAGGLLVPLNTREDQADVVRALGFPVVLVARAGLGTLNHTLLTIEAAARRGIAIHALFLVGPVHEANLATLNDRLAPIPIIALEEIESLCEAQLDEWLARNPLTELFE